MATLADTLKPIMSAESTPRALGMVLALAFLDTSLFQYFDQSIPLSLDDSIHTQHSSMPPTSDLDNYVSGYDSTWQTLRLPRAIVELYRLLCSSMPDLSDTVAYLGFRTVDRLTAASHRNQTLMNKAGLITPIFEALYPKTEVEGKIDSAAPHVGSLLPLTIQHVTRKTLRRLFDIGFCSPSEVWGILGDIKTPDRKAINSEVLGILRSGSKSKWPEFFSFQNAVGGSFEINSAPSTLEYVCEGGKAFPPSTGFTFMVRISPEDTKVIP